MHQLPLFQEFKNIYPKKEKFISKYIDEDGEVHICKFGKSDIWHILTRHDTFREVGGTLCGDIGLVSTDKYVMPDRFIVHNICRECLEYFHLHQNNQKIKILENPKQQYELYWRAKRKAEEREELFPSSFHVRYQSQIKKIQGKKLEKLDSMTLTQFQDLCCAYRGSGDNFNLNYWLIALGGEVGEILNVWKKYLRGDPDFSSEKVVMEKIAEEIGDSIIYAFIALGQMKFDVFDVLMEVHRKVRERIEAGGFHMRVDEK